ncbi:MAG: 4Fe-4S binding protein [Candidatus Stahlbacteria bacterium]|nr:MAG: 4Fe-4S binding protein [Candidatus Stahlbacteria bacterium]
MRRLLVQVFSALAMNFNVAGLIGRIFERIGKTPTAGLAKVIAASNNIVETTTKSICVPGLNCYSCPAAGGACPLGSIQHSIAIRQIPWFAAGSMLAISAVVGRMPCGFLCPFGFLQDLLYKIRTAKLGLPYWTHYLKFASLVIIAGLVVFLTGETWFCKLCPAGILGAGIPQVLLNPQLPRLLGWLFTTKLAILALTLTLSVFAKRPFCRVCALGAIFSLGNPVSLMRLRVDKANCNQCDMCYRVCPMEIKPYENPQSTACIRCLECTRCELIDFVSVFKMRDSRKNVLDRLPTRT